MIGYYTPGGQLVPVVLYGVMDEYSGYLPPDGSAATWKTAAADLAAKQLGWRPCGLCPPPCAAVARLLLNASPKRQPCRVPAPPA